MASEKKRRKKWGKYRCCFRQNVIYATLGIDLFSHCALYTFVDDFRVFLRVSRFTRALGHFELSS